MTFAWGGVRRREGTYPTDDDGDVAPRLELLPPGPLSARRPGCHLVATPEDFYALEAIWRELSASASTAFHSWDFAVEWFEQFVIARAGGATGRFAVVMASDARPGVIGLTPLFEEHLLGQPTLGTTLQPFGRSHAIETLTDEPIAIFRRGYENLATRMLASGIGEYSRSKGWDIAVLYGARRRQPMGRASISLSRRGDNIEVTRRRDLPLTVLLPCSWPSFESGLSKSMRDNIAYYPRRLTRELGPWKIKTSRSPSEVATATEHLIQLHRKRSESTTGPSHGNHLEGDRQVSFLRGWFQRLARRNQISIVSLEVAGRTVAAQAFVEAGRCVSVYYSGYDERWGRYSPLTIITAEMIRGAIERGFERVEFPPAEKAWKSRWGAVSDGTVEERSIYALNLPALLRGLARRLNERHPARTEQAPTE